MNTNKQRVLIVTLLFLVVGSCAGYATIDLPIRADAQENHMYWESVERGALLYANNCRTCHGNQGEGFIAPALNTPEWRDQDPVALQENRDILYTTLYCGRAGTRMPAWLDENGGSLKVRQIDWLVNLITAPAEGDEHLDESGQPTSIGWVDALEFAHNLNMDMTPSVGGDLLSSIANQHNIGVDLLAEANDVPMSEVGEVLPRGEMIQVPANSAHPDGFEYQVAGEFDTIETLAANLYVGAAAIADLNGLQFDIDYAAGEFTLLDENGEPLPGLLPGETLQLPEGATYNALVGETLEEIAEKHGISVAELRAGNEDVIGDIADDEGFESEVTLVLPPIDAFVIEGQTLEEIAEGYGNVTAESLAAANGFAADDVLRVGTVLQLPPEAFGTAPGDAINDGSACVQHAVSQSDFQNILGEGDGGDGDFPPAEAPEEFTDELVVRSYEIDWTFEADGEELEPNRGVVKIRPGSSVLFENVGQILHSVTRNDETEDAQFTPGSSLELEFPEEGEFRITCDYHPEQDGYIFVEEDTGEAAGGGDEGGEGGDEG